MPTLSPPSIVTTSKLFKSLASIMASIREMGTFHVATPWSWSGI